MNCTKDIQTFVLCTPVGDVILKVCSQGLHYLNQKCDITDDNFSPEEQKSVTLIGKIHGSDEIQTHVTDCILWLKTYFKNPRKNVSNPLPSICIASENGSFQEKMWFQLAKNVPPGQTVTYAELAQMVNSPGASRAVGTAMASNPLQILVPCHRVVRSDGSLGQYSRGRRNKVKMWLLKHEGLHIISDKLEVEEISPFFV